MTTIRMKPAPRAPQVGDLYTCNGTAEFMEVLARHSDGESYAEDSVGDPHTFYDVPADWTLVSIGAVTLAEREAAGKMPDINDDDRTPLERMTQRADFLLGVVDQQAVCMSASLHERIDMRGAYRRLQERMTADRCETVIRAAKIARDATVALRAERDALNAELASIAKALNAYPDSDLVSLAQAMRRASDAYEAAVEELREARESEANSEAAYNHAVAGALTAYKQIVLTGVIEREWALAFAASQGRVIARLKAELDDALVIDAEFYDVPDATDALIQVQTALRGGV